MAKNWMIAEVADVYRKGTDKSALADIGLRFPLTARLLAMANEAGLQLIEAFPDYLTVRKLESKLKDGVEKYKVDDSEIPEDAVPEDDEAIEKPKRGRKAKAADDDEEEEVTKKRRGRKPKKAEELEPEEEEIDDEDEDEEEEEVKPKKRKAKKEEEPKKKSKKPVAEDDDDDDDFDFDDED